jgi:hypothetical protein
MEPPMSATPIPPPTQAAHDGFLADRLAESDRIRERTAAQTADLDEPRLFWTPTDGSWSVAQVFEHLALLNESYLPGLRGALETARRKDAAPPSRAWRPTFVGRMLAGMVAPEAKRKSPTMKLWQPTRSVRRDAVQAFLATQDAIDDSIRKAHGADLNRIRLHSPASRLVRLNLGDVFLVLNLHALRHLDQVGRIRARPDFPAAH